MNGHDCAANVKSSIRIWRVFSVVQETFVKVERDEGRRVGFQIEFELHNRWTFAVFAWFDASEREDYGEILVRILSRKNFRSHPNLL